MNNGINILLITTDQQRKDTLGCYGNSLIHTPNIDAIAKKGIALDREYCENPVCIPSRNTLITGRLSRHHGAVLHNAGLRDGEPTLAGLLSQNGYRTHFIGKPHFKSQGHEGSEESVQDWLDGKYDNWCGPYAGFHTVELILGHCNIFTGHYGRWLKENYGGRLDCFRASRLRPLDVSCGNGAYKNDIPEALHSSSYVGDRTCAFLKKAAADKQPFFCFASFPSPHWPLMPPQEYAGLYDKVIMPASIPYQKEADKENYPWQFHELVYEGGIPYDGFCKFVKDTDDIAPLKRLYWGEISLIDKNVGRIMGCLAELGLEENTVVVFTTDHGEYMGDHGMMAKGGFLWESFVNLPCIFSFPGQIPANGHSAALFSHVDIAPTLLDMIGVDGTPLCADGISQAQVLRGNVETLRDCVTIMHPAQTGEKFPPDQHALVTSQWKLVYYAGTGKGELYYLEEDPSELNNLYNRPEVKNIQLELTLKLLDELIFSKDKYAVYQQAIGREIRPFIMRDEMWEKQFEEVKSAGACRERDECFEQPLQTRKA